MNWPHVVFASREGTCGERHVNRSLRWHECGGNGMGDDMLLRGADRNGGGGQAEASYKRPGKCAPDATGDEHGILASYYVTQLTYRQVT